MDRPPRRRLPGRPPWHPARPTGCLRAFTLFDRAGAHVPWGLPWPALATERAAAAAVVAVLSRHGATVTRSRPTLPATR
ncbi:MAG: hypothetical protein H0V33_05490 [Acidimicrobiia bacterium]|nr:hypothetical protein [Acidimicrobiia bacterium]